MNYTNNLTLWTKCPFSAMEWEYLSTFENKNLLCHNCPRRFLAKEYSSNVKIQKFESQIKKLEDELVKLKKIEKVSQQKIQNLKKKID
jgi:hypothetical protein